MKGVEIQSDRFFLRALSACDVSDKYYDWLHSKDKSQYIEYSKDNRTIDELREYVNQRASDGQALLLGIFDIFSGIHIGNIKYEPIDFKNGTAVMGILIGDKSYRGAGVAPEVIRVSADWLWSEYKISKIFLGVDRKNVRAISAYTKVGFRKIPPLIGDGNSTISMMFSHHCS